MIANSFVPEPGVKCPDGKVLVGYKSDGSPNCQDAVATGTLAGFCKLNIPFRGPQRVSDVTEPAYSLNNSARCKCRSGYKTVLMDKTSGGTGVNHEIHICLKQ